MIVLELCEGETLDMRLKMHGPLVEKEAKTIVIQILPLTSSAKKWTVSSGMGCDT